MTTLLTWRPDWAVMAPAGTRYLSADWRTFAPIRIPSDELVCLTCLGQRPVDLASNLLPCRRCAG